MEYRGYTIEKEMNGYGYDYYEGDVDCDWDGDGWNSNVRNASTIQDAKMYIDEIIFEDQEYTVNGITFKWLIDALQCIKLYGGELECRYEFDSI